MKKLALILAVVMVMLAFVACGAKKCHTCGATENVEKVGDHVYCLECIENGDMTLEDAAKYLEQALGELEDLGLGDLDLGDLGF